MAASKGFRNTFASAAREPSLATAPIDAGGGSVGAASTAGVGVARAMTIDPSIDASKSGGRSRSGECKGAVHFSSRAGSMRMRFFGRSLTFLCGRRSSFSCRAPSASRSFWGVVLMCGFAGGRAASSTLRGRNGCRGAAIFVNMGVLAAFCRPPAVNLRVLTDPYDVRRQTGLSIDILALDVYHAALRNKLPLLCLELGHLARGADARPDRPLPSYAVAPGALIPARRAAAYGSRSSSM